jgi:pimeloyl-ACP methyl ester carboxylesterase
MALQVQPQDKTVMANGLKLHYLDWGAPENPPMVLLHGLRGHAPGEWPPCVKPPPLELVQA